MNLRALLRRFVWVSAGLAVAVLAHAEAPAEPDPAGYREAISEGIRAYREHRLQAARSEFSHAHTLLPSARTLRALGMVAFELRDYVACVSFLEGALAADVRPLDGPMQERAKELLASAREHV